MKSSTAGQPNLVQNNQTVEDAARQIQEQTEALYSTDITPTQTQAPTGEKTTQGGPKTLEGNLGFQARGLEGGRMQVVTGLEVGAKPGAQNGATNEPVVKGAAIGPKAFQSTQNSVRLRALHRQTYEKQRKETKQQAQDRLAREKEARRAQVLQRRQERLEQQQKERSSERATASLDLVDGTASGSVVTNVVPFSRAVRWGQPNSSVGTASRLPEEDGQLQSRLGAATRVTRTGSNGSSDGAKANGAGTIVNGSSGAARTNLTEQRGQELLDSFAYVSPGSAFVLRMANDPAFWQTLEEAAQQAGDDVLDQVRNPREYAAHEFNLDFQHAFRVANSPNRDPSQQMEVYQVWQLLGHMIAFWLITRDARKKILDELEERGLGHIVPASLDMGQFIKEFVAAYEHLMEVLGGDADLEATVKALSDGKFAPEELRARRDSILRQLEKHLGSSLEFNYYEQQMQ